MLLSDRRGSIASEFRGLVVVHYQNSALVCILKLAKDAQECVKETKGEKCLCYETQLKRKRVVVIGQQKTIHNHVTLVYSQTRNLSKSC